MQPTRLMQDVAMLWQPQKKPMQAVETPLLLLKKSMLDVLTKSLK